MQTKTKELLYLLLWAYESMSRPTWRNLTESFEGWAYRRGFNRQLYRLEQQLLLERRPSASRDRLYRLTAVGRLQALGGRDPEANWNRHWDGRWRIVLFDVPDARHNARDRLRRYLKTRGFGYLQHSVWITPNPLNDERSVLIDGPVDVESLILLEAHPCSGESHADIVAGAWDFAEINRCYVRHRQILDRRPRGRLDSETAAKTYFLWLREERKAWEKATGHDPFLPQVLLPQAYTGRQAWCHRQKSMIEVGSQLRTFKAS